jgi:hypothetical protein
MRIARTLAAISLAILLGTGLAGPGHILAHPAHELPAGGYIFAGLADGHIYRSSDGGTTWEEADAGLSGGILSLALAPDGTTVYAGTRNSGLWASAGSVRFQHKREQRVRQVGYPASEQRGDG